MSKLVTSIAVATACLLGVASVSGCATTSRTVDSGAELAQASKSVSDTVVYGKFRLVRNGQQATLGEGIFANTATLHLYQNGNQREIVGKVGRGGEFAWVLQPGTYHLTNIGFSHRGEKLSPQTNFVFVVSDAREANYIGTITLEATIDSGYLGHNGIVDRITVKDDCATDCAARLTRLGLTANDSTTTLLRWEQQVAGIN